MWSAPASEAARQTPGRAGPGVHPLPSKITIRVLPPLDLRESLGPDADPEEGYRLVTSTMQRTLTGLANKRRFPVIG
jgi:hypothetical protein